MTRGGPANTGTYYCVGAGSCDTGVGTDNVCLSTSLGGQTVNLVGVNADGDVGGDNKIYVGIACE